MAKINKKKRNTLYDFFHKNPLAGKGVSKNDTLPRNFKNFFKLMINFYPISDSF